VHDTTSFFVSFPEFSEGGAPQLALVQAKLDEAQLQIDEDVWGDHADAGHGYLTAHLLAMSPMGNTAKLTDGKTTTYEIHYRRLLGIVAAGIRST
jgi:hypothetical protein